MSIGKRSRNFISRYYVRLAISMLIIFLIFHTVPTFIQKAIYGNDAQWWLFWSQTAAGNWSADLKQLSMVTTDMPTPSISRYEFALSVAVAALWNNLLVVTLFLLLWRRLSERMPVMELSDISLLRDIYTKKEIRHALLKNNINGVNEEQIVDLLDEAYNKARADLIRKLPKIADDPKHAEELLKEFKSTHNVE